MRPGRHDNVQRGVNSAVGSCQEVYGAESIGHSIL